MTAPVAPPRVPLKEYLSSHRAIIKDMIAAYQGYQHRFGETFKLKLVSRDVIVTTSPGYARHILIANQRNYLKDYPTKVVGSIIGNGILTSDGPFWLRQRRLVQPAFHKQQLQNLSRLMVEETEGVLAKLANRQGQEVEVFREMVALTLNVVSRSLFSTGIDEQGLHVVETSVDSLMDLAVAKIRNPLQVLGYKLTGKTRFFDQCQKDLDELIYRIIDDRRSLPPQNQDILDMLLSSKDAETGEVLSREQLKDELLVLFLAGHETSANALTWTLMLLDQHPEVQERMRQEVDEVLGDGSIGFEHLPRLRYIKQVIDEALRLYPSAWILGREAIEEDEYEGIKVEPGKQVSIFIYGLHRNPQYWENPEIFDPERFAPGQAKSRPTHAYLPFGGGPRMCIGHQFAVFEMQIALALLMKNFTFKRTTHGPIPMEPSITLRPAAPMPMIFKLR